MRKYLKFFIYFTLAMVGMFTACSDEESPVQAIRYPLPEHMQIDVRDDLPVIIKTEAEFNALFSAYAGQLEKIDFNRYDLVYLQSDAYEPEIFETWLDTSVYPYQIYVRIDSNFEGHVERWAVAYLLPKSDANQVVFDWQMHAV